MGTQPKARPKETLDRLPADHLRSSSADPGAAALLDLSPAIEVVRRYRGVEDTVRRAEDHARRARTAIAPFPDGGAQSDLLAAAEFAVARDR